MKIKTIIMYYYYFLVELIKINPVKCIYIFICAITFHFAGTLPDIVKVTKIEKEIKVDTGWVYLCQEIKDNKIDYNLIYSNERIKIKNGEISTMEYNSGNVAIWFIFSIFLLILLVSTFIADDDTNWEFSELKRLALGRMVLCEIQDGYFYYTIGDRLVGKLDRQYSNYDHIASRLGIYCLSDVKIRPKFESKTRKRNRLLNKLGVI